MNKKKIFIIFGAVLVIALCVILIVAEKTITGQITANLGEGEEKQIDKNDCQTLSDGSLICKIGTTKIKGGKTKIADDRIKP